MSIFGKIRDAIFGGAANAAPAPAPEAPAGATPTAPPTAPAAATPTAAATPASTASAPSAAAAGAGAAKVVLSKVDVAAQLDMKAEAGDEELDWRVSIVDLMKLLKLDSSLKARKELAKELAYQGDMNDSAKMNVWLHKQVMTKLAENGGIVPDDLKH